MQVKNKIIFLGFLFLLNICFGISYVNAGAYNASDVLGQVDESENPVYTRNVINNNPIIPGSQGFSNPTMGLTDPVHHRLFVSDSTNQRILIFNLDSSNHLIDHTADYVLGKPNFNFNPSPGTSSSTLYTAHGLGFGLAYDSVNDRLFVANYANNDVMIWDFSSGITNGMPASHVLGATDYVWHPDPVSPTSSNMKGPTGLYYDTTSSQLFVSDFAHNRILIFDLSSGITDGMPAAHVLGRPDFTSSGIGTSSSRVWSVVDIFYDSTSSKLFAADAGNSRVLIWDLSSGITDGMPASHVLGQTDFVTRTTGTTSSTLNVAGGLSYDALNQQLFVGDTFNNRILIFDLSSGITDGMPAAHVLGQIDFISAGTGTSSSTLTHWIAAGLGLSLGYDSSSSQLVVADNGNNRVMIFDLSSGITDGMPAADMLGQLDAESNPDYSTNSASYYFEQDVNARGFDGLSDNLIDSVHHRLFVTDTGNNRVLIFNLDSSNNLIDHTADYVLGQTDFLSTTADTTSSTLDYPYGLAYDSVNDYLFVSDYFNSRVLIFDLSSGITDGMPAAHVLGQTDFISSDCDATPSLLCSPYGLVYSFSSNQLFVADSDNSRVMIWDLSSGITDGMPAAHVLGQTDFISYDGGTSSVAIGASRGLALNADSNQLFVADTNNNRVLIFDLSSGITDGMPAAHVLGQGDFDSSDTGTSSISMSGPRGLVLNIDSNQLFVSDSDNNRVLIFDLSSGITDGMPAVGVLGQTDFSFADLGLSQSMFNKVSGLSFDSTNNRLYVVDSVKDSSSTNNRIMIFNLIKFSTSLSSATTKVTYSSDFSSINNQGVVDYSVTGGSLPPGLTISGSTLSGVPSTSGTYSFIIQANDAGDWGVFADPLSFDFDVLENFSTGSSGSCKLPTPPEGGFKILINNSEKSSSHDVVLNLHGGPNTKRMIISNDSSFSNLKAMTKQIEYKPSFNWNLCEGETSCVEGVHSVYVKFYSGCGRASEIVSDSISYKETKTGITLYNFGLTTLKFGSVGEPVKELQRFFNKFLNTNLTIDGKLGPKTLAIIKEWQKNNDLVVDGLVGIKTKLNMNIIAKSGQE